MSVNWGALILGAMCALFLGCSSYVSMSTVLPADTPGIFMFIISFVIGLIIFVLFSIFIDKYIYRGGE